MTESRPGGLAGIIAAIRRHWIAALIGFLIVMIPAGLLIVMQKNDYKSQAVVGIVPVGSMSDPFLRSMGEQLITSLTAPQVLAEVGQKTGLTPDEVDRAVTLEIPTATLNVAITAQGSDPQLTAQVANEMANQAIADTSYKRFFSQRLLAPAVPADRPSGLGRGLLLAAALVIAVVVAAVVALLARDLSGSLGATADESSPEDPTGVTGALPGPTGPQRTG